MWWLCDNVVGIVLCGKLTLHMHCYIDTKLDFTSTICISKSFAETLEIQAETDLCLANWSECFSHEIEVDIKSPFIENTLLALTIECPLANVIIGEMTYIKNKSRSEEIFLNNNTVKVALETETCIHFGINGQISDTVMHKQNESPCMRIEKQRE